MQISSLSCLLTYRYGYNAETQGLKIVVRQTGSGRSRNTLQIYNFIYEIYNKHHKK